jgi:endonuclease/exonuclease/phosphatase family metal-dependent hydrolase
MSSVCANSDEEEIDAFYNALQEAVNEIPRKDKVIVMGDLNAKVGDQYEDSYGAVGRHGYGKRNNRIYLL